MKAKFVFANLLFILSSISISFAQRHQFISLGGGGAYYFGDLSDNLSTTLIRPAGVLSYGRYVNPQIIIKAGALYANLAGSDKFTSDPLRAVRNLHFRTTVYEGNLSLVFEFFKDKGFLEQTTSFHFTPYAGIGVAMFRFNPQANFNGTWYDLQPLGTEGQNLEGTPGRYSIYQISIPVSGGFAFRFGSRIGVHLDFSYRFSHTDYLDDVSTVYADPSLITGFSGTIAGSLSNRSGGVHPIGSQRGNPSFKDGFAMATFSVVFYMRPKNAQ